LVLAETQPDEFSLVYSGRRRELGVHLFPVVRVIPSPIVAPVDQSEAFQFLKSFELEHPFWTFLGRSQVEQKVLLFVREILQAIRSIPKRVTFLRPVRGIKTGRAIQFGEGDFEFADDARRSFRIPHLAVANFAGVWAWRSGGRRSAATTTVA
jgi:hypothetical protein